MILWLDRYELIKDVFRVFSSSGSDFMRLVGCIGSRVRYVASYLSLYTYVVPAPF